MARGVDAIVIGAGAIGLAVARELAAGGRRVAVLERDARGGQASRAAAGMLAPQVEAEAPGELFALAVAARERFAPFAQELAEQTGLPLDYRADGLIASAFEVEEESELARRAEWQRAAGQRVEEITRAEAHARWPALELPRTALAAAPRFAEGRLFHFPDEAQVDTGLLLDALDAAAAAAGVELHRGREARGLIVKGDAVRGVRLDGGEVGCELVVNAAGCWAGRVAAWVGELLPVEPVRGEMLSYPVEHCPPCPIVVGGGAYVLLRAGGRLLVGATAERVGYEASPTAAGAAWLADRGVALRPALAGQPPSAHWAGLRPATPDGLPILGFSSDARGLYHATGHYRTGILLAPVTADLVNRAVAGDPAAAAATAPFDPGRFAARLESAP